MLEIGAAIGDVGDGEERGLHGNAADGIGQRQRRQAIERSRDRRRDPRQRGRRTEQHGAGEGLAEAGAIGEAVADRAEPRTGHADHRGGEREQRDRPGQTQREDSGRSRSAHAGPKLCCRKRCNQVCTPAS